MAGVLYEKQYNPIAKILNNMKVCLLVDCTGIREYFVSALEKMVSETDAELSLVVVDDSHSDSPETIRDAVADHSF